MRVAFLEEFFSVETLFLFFGDEGAIIVVWNMECRVSFEYVWLYECVVDQMLWGAFLETGRSQFMA